MRTVDVVTEVVIHRPLKDVVAYASDPDNAPNWYTAIKAVVWKTPRPAGLGSRVAFVAQFLGRESNIPTQSPSWFQVSDW